ncbi:MAG TPA: hypothetical protein VIC29_01335 [Steroidobacteraceae bacterium]
MNSVVIAGGRLRLATKQVCDAASLRAWLAGRWAILFSHPDDFAQEQLEMDRWLSILSRSFAERGVTAVAMSRDGYELGQGWIGGLAELGPASAAALTLDPSRPGAVADLSAGALRAQIGRHGPRCALIVDSNLRCRRTLRYRPMDELPSPLDLIGWAVTLRKRDHSAASREAPPPDTRLSPRFDGLFYRCSGRMIFQPPRRWA